MENIITKCACCLKENVYLVPRLAADGETLMELCSSCDQAFEKEKENALKNPRTHKKWEYEVYMERRDQDPLLFLEVLNDMGDQGWELISKEEELVDGVEAAGPAVLMWVCFFKRPKL